MQRCLLLHWKMILEGLSMAYTRGVACWAIAVPLVGAWLSVIQENAAADGELQ